MSNLGDVMQIDLALCAELDTLIESLTTSGKPTLDPDKLKSLKKICRQSDDYVRKVFHSLMVQLEKQHSEIRLSALQLCDQLFHRSHCFRDQLLVDFQYFMELVMETNADFPLPPPKKAAQALKSTAAQYIHQWTGKFGDVYKKLTLGYHYLKDCKKVNFEDIEVRSVAERRRAEEQRVRAETQQRERVQRADQEMTDILPEIKTCLTQGENCLALLLPDLDSFDIPGLQSPEIFRTHDPWQRQKSSASSTNSRSSGRHVNKSTKTHRKSSTTSKSKDDEISVKAEVDFESVEVKVENDVTQSGETTCSNSTKLDNNVSTKDVKPTAEELQKSLETYQEHKKDESKPIDTVSNTSATSDHNKQTENQSDSDEDEEMEDVEDSNPLRGHGFTSQTLSINIPMMSSHMDIQETADNEDILRTLKDCGRLIDNEFLPVIARWMEVFAKAGADETRVKRALDIKQALHKMKDKVSKINVLKAARARPATCKSTADSEDSDSDADFEEVTTKEGYEPRIPEDQRAEYGLVDPTPRPPTNPDWDLPRTTPRDQDDPTTFMSTIKVIKAKLEQEKSDKKPSIPVKDHPAPTPSHEAVPSTSSGAFSEKKATPSDVPLVPFGTDLFHWGKKMEMPLMVRYDSEHRFMAVQNDGIDTVDKNALASMKSRVINYTGTFEPVKWKCLAPLSNGTLCQRMDRVKCPFHGKIVARNAVGEPVNEDDRLRIKKEELQKQLDEPPEWEDPDFQRDLKAATGIDLERKGRHPGSKGKGQGGKKGKARPKKFPGLTDIKKVHNTARTRLEGKVLSKQALSRVVDSMNAIDAKRRQDKFGNSFNYVHSRR